MARVPAHFLVWCAVAVAVAGCSGSAPDAAPVPPPAPPVPPPVTAPVAAPVVTPAAPAGSTVGSEPVSVSPADAKIRADLSYAFGQQMAETVSGLDLDSGEVARGLREQLAGTAAPIDQAQLRSELQQYQAGQATRKVGAFKNRKGVTTLPDGLMYEVLASGAGRTPLKTDTVSVNYKGTLLDGTVFDESARHGGPATFPLNGVIAGWTEVVSMMKEGDKWRVCIPPELAYGERGQQGIPPNSWLIFEIELLKVVPTQAAAPGPNP